MLFHYTQSSDKIGQRDKVLQQQTHSVAKPPAELVRFYRSNPIPDSIPF